MKPIVMMRREYHRTHTLGTVTLPDGSSLRTMEPPWKDNQRNISCIPAGFYLCAYLERSGSGRYKRCWHVQDVPNRSGILWHCGNFVRHTMGCILPGKKSGTIGETPAVFSSLAALNVMRDYFGKNDFYLVIT